MYLFGTSFLSTTESCFCDNQRWFFFCLIFVKHRFPNTESFIAEPQYSWANFKPPVAPFSSKVGVSFCILGCTWALPEVAKSELFFSTVLAPGESAGGMHSKLGIGHHLQLGYFWFSSSGTGIPYMGTRPLDCSKEANLSLQSTLGCKSLSLLLHRTHNEMNR